MLVWAAPWWMVALTAAVAAPLAAHLLSRRGGALAGFPTVRFVQQAAADVARLQRPRHWLLMLLRMLALVLIALAFADPRWLTAAPLDADSGLRVGVILDSSASMQRTDSGVTLFDRACRDAVAMLRSLDPARDRAVVILADRTPASVLPEPSGNVTALVAAVEAATASTQRGDLEAAIDLAAHQLTADRPGGPVRLALFTDAQHTIYPHAAIERWRDRGLAVSVHVLGRDQPNVAVRDVRLMPSQPVVGQPVLLRARVRSYADDPRQVTVRCGPQSRQVRLEARREADVIFELTFDEPGEAPVGVTLQVDDALAHDDTAGRVVEVIVARPVTLVTASDPMDRRSAAYFTARALTPSPDGRDEGIFLTVVTPDRLADLTPTPGGVWVLVEAGAIDAGARSALTHHVEAGGGVLWIVDSAQAAASCARWQAAPIVQPQWLAHDEATLAIGRFDDPVLAVFEGPGRSTLLDHTFTGYAAGTLAVQAEALLLASDGSPLLATAWHGGGRCAVFAGDLAPSATILARQPAWPALLHQLIRHLAPGPPPGPPTRPGDLLPDGSVAKTPGLIQTPAGAAWIELHPDESDLRPADHDAPRALPAAASTRVGDVQLRPAEKQLWPLLMLAALFLLACETLAAWRFDAVGGTHRLPTAPRAQEARRV